MRYNIVELMRNRASGSAYTLRVSSYTVELSLVSSQSSAKDAIRSSCTRASSLILLLLRLAIAQGIEANRVLAWSYTAESCGMHLRGDV